MFPLAVFVVLMTFTAFGISGSSTPLLATDAGSGDSVVFGLPRSIRSDEWIVHTPMVISQVENNLPRYGDVGVQIYDCLRSFCAGKGQDDDVFVYHYHYQQQYEVLCHRS
jgi:hypothetical protein